MLLFLVVVVLIFISACISKYLYKHEITPLEFVGMVLIPIVVLSIFWGISYKAKVHDFEIRTGEVLDKSREVTSCSHAYPCHCHTSCRPKRGCSTHCQTCHLHPFDFMYVVRSNVGSTTISREDSQGLITPKRFNEVVIGEPFSMEFSYSNYIKASKNSLFNVQSSFTKEEQKQLPEYPRVFDYYKVNHLVDLSGKLDKDFMEKLNADLRDLLKKQSVESHFNTVVFFTDKTEEFALRLIDFYRGGKKNDVLIFIGFDDRYKISFVRVHSWAVSSFFDVILRDSVMDLKTVYSFDLPKVLEEDIHDNYVLRSFKEFEYLRWQIIPTTVELVLYTLLCITLSFGLGYAFSKNEIRNVTSKKAVESFLMKRNRY